MRFAAYVVVVAWVAPPAGSVWAQAVAAPEHRRHAAVQEKPGEGDRGESGDVDEAVGSKPFDGPYASPYKLAFKVPAHGLLADHPNVQFNDYRGGLGTCAVEMC